METPEQIERALTDRLMPRGFSERGSASLDALIDELAAAAPEAPRIGPKAWVAAAAVGVAAGLAWVGLPPEAESPSQAGLVGLAEVVLLSESEGVVAAEADDRLMTDSDGNLLQGWHVTVVNEEVFRDGPTGHEVRVTHPRDELVLIPVTAF